MISNAGGAAFASREKAATYLSLAEVWKEKFLNDPATRKARTGQLNQLIVGLSGHNMLPRPERGVEEVKDLSQGFIELYEYVYALPPDIDQETVRKIASAAEDNGLEWHNSDQIRQLIHLFHETIRNQDKDSLNIFLRNVYKYSSRHALDNDARVGLENKLLPAIEADDPQISALKRESNMWGMHQGDFGIADFICHSYASKITPGNINELYMVDRTIPSTNLVRYDQNRLDGLTLVGTFGILRDFIHDQRPLVHDVIDAMVKYYDTGDGSNLESLLPHTDYLKSSDTQERILDRTRYDLEVEERQKDRNAPPKMIKVIDVLRRLQANTQPIEEHPPPLRYLFE